MQGFLHRKESNASAVLAGLIYVELTYVAGWNRLNGKELRQAISHFQDIKVCDAVQEELVLKVADRMHNQVLKDFSRQMFGRRREEHGEKAQISM